MLLSHDRGCDLSSVRTSFPNEECYPASVPLNIPLSQEPIDSAIYIYIDRYGYMANLRTSYKMSCHTVGLFVPIKFGSKE